MPSTSRSQRFVLLIAVAGVLALGAGMASSSSAQLPFGIYGNNPGAGPAPTLDRTGATIPRRGATTSARASRSGAFTFAFGPFEEDVTGKVTFVSTKAVASAKKRTLSLGTKRFTGLMDAKVRVKVKLSRRARKALKRARTIGIRASLKVSDANGNVTRRAYTFRLKRPK